MYNKLSDEQLRHMRDDPFHVKPAHVQFTAFELLDLRNKFVIRPGGDNLRLARRTAELSANIMRDINRTGGWEGAEKVARQFDRIASLLKEQLSDEQLRYMRDDPFNTTPTQIQLAAAELLYLRSKFNELIAENTRSMTGTYTR